MPFKLSFMKTALTAFGFSMLSIGAVNAMAITGLRVEGGGTQQVFALSNGNFLGLWGFDNREGANPGAGAVTLNDRNDLLAGFTSGTVVEFYNGTNPVNAGASEFDILTFPIDLADDIRLFDSVWVEWTGGNLVYQLPSNGTQTMNSTQITRQGDPFAVEDVPEPASLALLGAGLLAAGALRRLRAA